MEVSKKLKSTELIRFVDDIERRCGWATWDEVFITLIDLSEIYFHPCRYDFIKDKDLNIHCMYTDLRIIVKEMSQKHKDIIFEMDKSNSPYYLMISKNFRFMRRFCQRCFVRERALIKSTGGRYNHCIICHSLTHNKNNKLV